MGFVLPVDSKITKMTVFVTKLPLCGIKVVQMKLFCTEIDFVTRLVWYV